jgi:glucose/arabinose dehydrogenase
MALLPLAIFIALSPMIGDDSEFGVIAAAPRVVDPSLHVELVVDGLELPTSMAFLDNDTIVVLEKNSGQAKMIKNGELQEEPLIDANVSTQGERGMLGIATAQEEERSKDTLVFLYFTEANSSELEGRDHCPGEWFPDCEIENEPLGNRVYRYELSNDKLVNSKLLMDLPATPNRHNGGPLIEGPDGNIYLLIGDLDHKTKSQNVLNGSEADGTGGVLRITKMGKAVEDSILASEYPLNLYYAYGIRNSFGMDFDPISGNLWDTESGLSYGDEINLVEPGFNSGWSRIQGIWDSKKSGDNSRKDYWQSDDFHLKDIVSEKPVGLEEFGSAGRYSNPELTWNFSVTPTALKFLNSNKLGSEYQNDMFVGDFNNGNIYHFDLSHDRRELLLRGPLSDKVANNTEELEDVKFGWDFGAILDIEVGPDGFLYVLSLQKGGYDCRLVESDKCVSYNSSIGGAIHRVLPAAANR